MLRTTGYLHHSKGYSDASAAQVVHATTMNWHDDRDHDS